MAETFRLHVVTPLGEIVDEQVRELTAPGKDGEFGILPRHARYVTALGVGELRYVRAAGDAGSLAVAGGFAEVEDGHVNVIATTAEEATHIDVARAEAAMHRAQAMLEKPGADTDVGRASEALEKSLARLRVAKARGIKPNRTTIKTTEQPIPGEASDG